MKMQNLPGQRDGSRHKEIYKERPFQQLMTENNSKKTFENLRVTLNKTINDNEYHIAQASLVTLLMRNVCRFSEFAALELSYSENHV